MRRSILVLSILLAPALANAGKLLVLKSEGNADAATKAKVDAEVQKLAHALPSMQVEVGEVTFTDAAVAVGCSGSEAQCRDEVLSTMGVDEVIAVTVTTMPSGDTRVTIDRIAKGAPTKAGNSTIPAGQAIETKIENDVGANFGVKPAEPPPAPPPTTTTPPAAATTTTPPPAFGEPGAPPTTTEPPSGPPMNETPPPNQPQPEAEGGGGRGPVIGMAVGGGLVVLSLVMWGEASSTQNDINNAPTRTVADFQNLQNLESKGGTYATLGNVFFIGGIVTAGISGYFFWRNHRAHSSASSAMVTPTLFDHGAGLALTIGGPP
jgi:hypothetical protein